jgi:hypothetical protein
MRTRPRVHEYVREMNREALASESDFNSLYSITDSTKLAEHDIFTVGEAPYSRSANDLAEYVLPGNRELQMVFQFEVRKPLGYTHSDNLADLISARYDRSGRHFATSASGMGSARAQKDCQQVAELSSRRRFLELSIYPGWSKIIWNMMHTDRRVESRQRVECLTLWQRQREVACTICQATCHARDHTRRHLVCLSR